MTDKRRLDGILEFILEAERLKAVGRQNILASGRPENSAEHSWSLALMLIAFENDLPQGLDFTHMLKMAVAHDLVEVYAGDTHLYDDAANEGVREREENAAKKLFSLLPPEKGQEFMDLHHEFESQETQESQFVRSFDMLHGTFQNLSSKGKGWKRSGITPEMIRSKKEKKMAHSPLTMEIFRRIMDMAEERKLWE